MIENIIQAVQDAAYSISVNRKDAENDLRILKKALVDYFIVKDVGATLLTDTGARRIYPKDGNTFTLEEVQKYVDGNIEVIDLRDGSDFIMIVNEEGKFLKDVNLPATGIARKTKSIFPSDYVCGDVIICHTSMLP